MIHLRGIKKTFRVAHRGGGMRAAARALFSREYDYIHALDDLSFDVNDGEMVGYIGPNGAGKSSTIKVMSGILTPDAGECVIDGLTPWRDRVRHARNIGVVFGQRSQLWWEVPVIDSFELLRDIYRVSPTDYRRRLDDLTALLGATSLLNTPVRQLSLGQRMKCEFIGALLHGPRILFLDEPTIGLDAVTKLALRDFLIDLNRREGVTMLLTTHDMDDVEALCRRVMVIGKGRLLFSGGMDALRARYAPHRIIRARLAEDRAQLELIGAQSVTLNGRDALITFLPEETPAEQMIARLAAACPLADLTVEAPDIDHLVAEMYARMGMTT